MDNKRYLEIANKALEYSKSNFCPPDKDLTNYDIINAFDAGAQWADNNPAPNLVNIDKVCEWIDNNVDKYVFENEYGETYVKYTLTEDLRKAMKGE